MRDLTPFYGHSHIGYNYRLNNLLAAVGRGQFERLEERVARKRAINGFYRKTFQDLPGIDFIPQAPYGKSNCWLTVVLINPEEFGADREEVRLALEKENIESRPIWKPIHLQLVFQGCRVRGGSVSTEFKIAPLASFLSYLIQEFHSSKVLEVESNLCWPAD